MRAGYLHLVFLCLALNGCVAAVKPTYDMTVAYEESAPPEYKLGWQQGCASGISVYGNNYYKSMYKFQQDLSMIKNEYYFKAWNDSFNFCRSAINRTLAGDYKESPAIPSLLSNKNLNVTNGSKRDNAPITKQGIFGTDVKGERGLFSSLFDVKSPGYGSMAWGANPYNGKCDWLNRCGEDIPKDPMDVLMGQEPPTGHWSIFDFYRQNKVGVNPRTNPEE